MKLPILLSFISITLFCSCNAQSGADSYAPKTIDTFQFSLKTAHPNAQALMKEDFYWSPIEETAPFGSDDGSDAAYGFREWRATNKAVSPIVYLEELIQRWNYPNFNWNEMDTAKIKAYMAPKVMDEATIRQKMDELKKVLKNATDTTMKNVSDELLRQTVISAARQMGGDNLLGQDNAIIATGFAQFVLEGSVDTQLKALTITAIRRQLLPVLIKRWDGGYREIRKQQLTKMLGVMNKVH